MKLSHISLIAIMIVVIGVAVAGCTSSSPATPASSGAAPASGSTPASASTQSSAPAAGSALTGASIFGNLNYQWVEYKMSTGSGSDAMTIYMKYNHATGKCTMRFESAQKIEGMPSEMDCSSTGQAKSAGNPNQVNPDVKFTKVGTESVTVPAGTFVADKYTAIVDGSTGTYWIASGKPLLKMESAGKDGSAVMELNGWG
jgi:hypothetical protein